MNEEETKTGAVCTYSEACPQFPKCDDCATTANTLDPFPEDETPETTASAPVTNRPPLVVISAAELAEMTDEEIQSGKIPERLRNLRNVESEETKDDDEDDDKYTAEANEDESPAAPESENERMRICWNTMKYHRNFMRKRFIREAETRELTAELRRRNEEAFKPEISKVPLTVEQVREYINEACVSGYGSIRTQSTLRLLEEIKRRERARIFARKLATGKLTETEAKEFFEETRTRIFITYDAETEGAVTISVVIKYDGDCEGGKFIKHEANEPELFACELDTNHRGVPEIREFPNGKFCVVYENPSTAIIYTTDFFSTAYEAMIAWNALMGSLRTPEQKIHVYDYREMILAKTCDLDHKSDSMRIAERSLKFVKELRKSDKVLEMKELSDKFRERAGMAEWQEAMGAEAIFRAFINSIVICTSAMAAYENTKVFDSASGRYTNAVVFHGIEGMKKCAEYLGSARDALLSKICDAWEKANEGGTEAA